MALDMADIEVMVDMQVCVVCMADITDLIGITDLTSDGEGIGNFMDISMKFITHNKI